LFIATFSDSKSARGLRPRCDFCPLQPPGKRLRQSEGLVPARAGIQSHERYSTGGNVEQSDLAEALNGDLQTEFQSIIQYVNHIAVLKGAEYLGIIDELKVHLTQELDHALVLAEQVEFLGGTPTCTPSPVPASAQTDDAPMALKSDLQLERDQLDRYRSRFAQANDLGLADVAEALRPLLEQTQEHVRDLETALG
jgi:bacterioferritin